MVTVSKIQGRHFCNFTCGAPGLSSIKSNAFFNFRGVEGKSKIIYKWTKDFYFNYLGIQIHFIASAISHQSAIEKVEERWADREIHSFIRGFKFNASV